MTNCAACGLLSELGQQVCAEIGQSAASNCQGPFSGIDKRQERVTFWRSRLENAERIGRPAHIARCRSKLEGAMARATAQPKGTES